jgi:general secretion pathway protein K
MIRSQRGFALVITLIVTALLVALVTEFITDVYVDTSARQGYVDGQQASLLADSGISGALALLRFTRTGQNFSTLQDQWAKPLEIAEEKGALKVTIEEENAKLSLNHYAFPKGNLYDDHGMAERFFKKQGLSADLLDALADWVDLKDEPRPGGAETPYYAALKPAYAAKNAPLETLEELRLVKGFTREAFAKIQPFITVYADSTTAAPININTAPKELLAVMDERMTDDLAARIIEYRKTTPFKAAADLARVTGMESIATGLTTRVVVEGTIYRLRADAVVNGTTRTIETVVQFLNKGGKPKTLYWREY